MVWSLLPLLLWDVAIPTVSSDHELTHLALCQEAVMWQHPLHLALSTCLQ